MRALTVIGVLLSVSRLHIVAIAALGTLTFGWAFTGQYAFALAGITAVDWFVVNLLNRVVDLPEDAKNEIRGTGFVARFRRPLVVVGFSTLVLSLVLIHPSFPELWPLRVAFHILGLAYNWPLLPGGRRIKSLYFFKNTASAIGFMLTVFGFVLVSADRDRAWMHDISVTTVTLTSLFFFLFELSYEVIYDLRDAEGDRAAGIRTFPVVHGKKGAVRIIDALLVSSVLVLVGGYGAGVVPWRIAVMAVAPLAQFVIYKWLLRRGIQADDCIYLTWFGVGLLLAYHGWIAAGLPGV